MFKLMDHKYNIYFSHLTSVNDVLDDAHVIGKRKFRIQDYENLLRIANTNEELPIMSNISQISYTISNFLVILIKPISDVIGKIEFVLGSNLHDIRSTHKILLLEK